MQTLDDALNEADETFALTLTGVSRSAGVALGAATAIGTIGDNDDPPSLTIADRDAPEDAGTMEFPVTLDAESGRRVSVDYSTQSRDATENRDYTRTRGTLSFRPGDLEQIISVPIRQDDLDEPERETFAVALRGAVNAELDRRTATGTITDDDSLTASVAAAALARHRGRDGDLHGNRHRRYRHGAGPGGLLPGWDRGGGKRLHRARRLADAGDGGGERNDRDPDPRGPRTGGERSRLRDARQRDHGCAHRDRLRGRGEHHHRRSRPADGVGGNRQPSRTARPPAFVVTLNDDVASTVSVRWLTTHGTATAATDYTAASGTLTFSTGGSRSRTLEVTTLEDQLDEPAETFTVRLTEVLPATAARLGVATAAGTIADDERLRPC